MNLLPINKNQLVKGMLKLEKMIENANSVKDMNKIFPYLHIIFYQAMKYKEYYNVLDLEYKFFFKLERFLEKEGKNESTTI